MSKRDIIIFLFKWKNSLLGYFLFILVLSVFLVFIIPQKYEATAKLLVESNRAPVMRADVAYGAEQLSVLNSEVIIIRSNTVLAATVDQVGIGKAEEAEPAGFIVAIIDEIKQWMLDVGLREAYSAREEMINSLEDDLKVEPQPNSNVIAISYKSDNPVRAASIINTVTEKYIQHHLKIFSSGGTSEIYRIQIENLEKKLAEARNKLQNFKTKKSVSALNDTMRALVQQKSILVSDLSNTKQELAELNTRFGSGHTKVQLAEERQKTTQRSLAEITQRLQELEQDETTIKEMELEINSVEKSIESYRHRYQDEQLVNMANTDVVNVLIIENATVPSRPNHSRLFYIILASIGGLLVSFAIAFINEYFDHTVTDPEVASQLLGVPTLGSIEKA